uniref:Transmembrane protein 79b n=1 Tax=Oryzias latipes TaxID=8090 RepID=A0A3P9J558_ORYLA
MDRQEEPQGSDPNMTEPSKGLESGSPAAQIPGRKKLQDSSSQEEEAQDSSEEEEEEGGGGRSPALQESSTLLWSGHLNRKILLEQGGGGPEEGELEVTDRSRWRESMPEGEKWRDEEPKEEDCWLADDEEEEDEDGDAMSVKPATEFTPHVTIVNQNHNPEEVRAFAEEEVEDPVQLLREEPFPPERWDENDKLYLCDHVDQQKLGLLFSILAGGLLFPLLVWGGYALLPFDPPVVGGPALRVIYTLRCAFFGVVPVVLGVLVQGAARLRHCALKPLYLNGQVDREVKVHEHYVSQSLALFLFYFLQLAVLATYISQDLVKLVPLLTIIFVFGRLIYWLCLALDSSIRGLGFAFSFLPMVVMMGANLYYMCSSVGQDAIFDVAVPTTPPPPRLRWWF